ncbi:hypothetical protein F4821DRAFT_101875 [Hypoxylon rubiginosum]|uniref:Uncharacterized protein n=1 Tax=Hypoxylon rubiginosum TaxID=110542 RepID=A0ACC0D4G1_9PEZI|nr:hypothetical protein F4821DRAFT_101875 [Hypoxylon rubiginosum]
MEPSQNSRSEEEHESEYSDPPSEEYNEPELLFTRFMELPPELRHKIWRDALPTPGINFFNVHCIPNDHPGTNRSTSPSWLYLDLRRISIDDDDDDVEEYDPSTWYLRSDLSAVCREARAICAKPSETAIITLTRPKRGLFVRAGDGQLRSLVPTNPAKDASPEPLVRRHIRVSVNDILCLSVENCSFNLPYEELPAGEGGGNVGTRWEDRGGFDFDVDVDSDIDEEELGWAYDPLLMPAIPYTIPERRRCMNMARPDRTFLNSATEVGSQIMAENPEDPRNIDMVMFDAHNQVLSDRLVKDLARLGDGMGDVCWDRFGDHYVQLPDVDNGQYVLAKVWPEYEIGLRERYLQSASIQSSKRPVRSS